MSAHIQWLPVTALGKVLHGTVYSDHHKRHISACAPSRDMNFLAPELVHLRGSLPKCKKCEAVFRAYPEMENPV